MMLAMYAVVLLQFHPHLSFFSINSSTLLVIFSRSSWSLLVTYCCEKSSTFKVDWISDGVSPLLWLCFSYMHRTSRWFPTLQVSQDWCKLLILVLPFTQCHLLPTLSIQTTSLHPCCGLQSCTLKVAVCSLALWNWHCYGISKGP